jgi:hypothetical protein
VVEDGLEEVVEDGLEGGAGAGFGFSPAHAAASPRARPAKITVAAKLLAAPMILSVSIETRRSSASSSPAVAGAGGRALRVLGPGFYKPFGTGPRACIGRQFALHEAMLTPAAVLHQFDVQADPEYALRISETLTFKPSLPLNSGFTFSAEPLF